MKLTIDRSKWRCGFDGPYKHGEGETKLLNSEGYMCCLGQIELQLGFTPEKIKNISYPTQLGVENILSDIYVDEDGVEYVQESALSIEAVSHNDSEELSRETREYYLIELFKEKGHELTFINEYGDKDVEKSRV